MTIRTFNLLNSINCEGVKHWNITYHVFEVSTKEFYGTIEDIMLESGVWISVYEDSKNPFDFMRKFAKPNYILHYEDGCNILLFHIND